MQEHKTSGYILAKLKEAGFTKIITNVAQTGVVAELPGEDPSQFILLRADMDALPIREKTNLPFASKVDGMHHACVSSLPLSIARVTMAIVPCCLPSHSTSKNRSGREPSFESESSSASNLERKGSTEAYKWYRMKRTYSIKSSTALEFISSPTSP